MFYPYTFKTPRGLQRGDHMCETLYKKEVTIVDERGKFLKK